MKEPLANFVRTGLGAGMVLITCGLPSTGKSGSADMVASIKGYPLLRTDLIRRALLKNEDIFDSKVAGDLHRRAAVYDEMFRRADETLKKSDGVILDATFFSRALRERAAALADRHGKTLVILETVCPQEIALRRIRERTREESASNALTAEAYLNNKRAFEEVDIDRLKRLYPALKIVHLTVDTSRGTPAEWSVTARASR